MKTLKCNQPTYFDVDDTLVMWRVNPADNPKGLFVTIKDGKYSQAVMVNEENVKALKEHKLRQHTIIVWSQGGHRWAKAVVEALGLEDHVDLVLEKPKWFYDDLTANEFMGIPQWKGKKEWL